MVGFGGLAIKDWLKYSGYTSEWYNGQHSCFRVGPFYVSWGF